VLISGKQVRIEAPAGEKPNARVALVSLRGMER
jgi:hypothetical protein